MKTCRFCQTKSANLLFGANKMEGIKDPNIFACTNCGFGQHGEILECSRCGIIYVNENITQRKISTYYEVAEDPLYFSEQSARRKTFLKYLIKLKNRFPNVGRLLDIGTNTGLFVRLAQDLGWEALGLEPNKWAVEYAKKNYGINLINKPFEKNTFPAESFEVITMWDVIEHFTDPVSEMKKVFHQLKPGGLFAFSTTDPKSLLAKLMGTKWPWYMEMHRVFFSRAAASCYLKKIGFKKIIFMTHWRYLSLGYLASRIGAINPLFSEFCSKAIKYLNLQKFIVPYYANDLYDCYAYK